MGRDSHPADTVELHDPHGLLHGNSIGNGHPFTNSALEQDPIVPPDHAVSALPAWNQSRANIFKTFTTFIAFIIMGANDAAYGVSRYSSGVGFEQLC